jgi:hypothetical protein
MKNSKNIMINTAFTVLVIGSLVVSLAGADSPSPPHGFYGSLYIDSSPAPAGTNIQAWVGAEDRTFNGPFQTTLPGAYGGPLGTDVKLLVDCETGETITFFINSVEANEQATCDTSAGATFLPLSSGNGGPECVGEETQSCYTGPQGTEGIGECSAGTQTCIDSYWGPCEGETLPTAETCDGLDNNCDGSTDEGVKNIYYEDSDDDGYGNPASTTEACTAPEGYVEDSTDCDDSAGSVNPGADEVCDNGVDDNCDLSTDCLDSSCSEFPSCLPEEYCLEITGLRVLGSDHEPATDIIPGTMYHIEVTTFNDCEYGVESMQIIQVSSEEVPLNIGTVTSTIGAYSESVITAGFVLPSDTTGGAVFDVDAFNWNHWNTQPGYEALSLPESASFQTSS